MTPRSREGPPLVLSKPTVANPPYHAALCCPMLWPFKTPLFHNLQMVV